MGGDDPLARFRLEGKRAFVTGVGRGLGGAILESLAAAGSDVTLSAPIGG